MTFQWGRRSLGVRSEIHEDLVTVVDEVLATSWFDLTMTEGRRTKELQNHYFDTGASELRWPDGRHNFTAPEPSMAVHIDPYPIDYSDEGKFRYFALAGMMWAVSKEMGIKLRWLGETTLNDLAHWEIPR